ncbi:4-hydroxybenzoyl-CoA thioesterase [Neosynechococcus sphagnicola sy1]|uniref:4-hydroxybenzoyl-CoA thioesterase n=1 Tax=Neosynechococcus sphagnicola sy1 TaxID=1497020 RepID=A0A098TIP4_9CYAN|nr:thioesterase family protein [Neosynechococcus sphagnicola]KGF72435.1 4-hydroxybenzoyl-CoA thioesterase [Neosynechococcus sphagnicola sy1]
MTYQFKTQRQVEFAETDMAGVAHFTHFFRWMEAAEHAFFRSLGISVLPSMGDQPPLLWPRVQATCDYRHPLRFEDQLEVHLIVAKKQPKSLTYTFIFRNLTQQPDIEVARGQLTVVCATVDPVTSQLTSQEIPAAIAAKITVAPQ